MRAILSVLSIDTLHLYSLFTVECDYLIAWPECHGTGFQSVGEKWALAVSVLGSKRLIQLPHNGLRLSFQLCDIYHQRLSFGCKSFPLVLRISGLIEQRH